MWSIRVSVPQVLKKVASPPERVFDHCQVLLPENVPEQRGCKRSPVTAWFASSSLLVMPIRSLRSVTTCGVLRFGVSQSVFLSHSARLYTVAARLAASLGFGGQYIRIAAMSSLPVSKLDGASSSLQLRWCVKCSHHMFWLPCPLASCHAVRHQTCARSHLLISPQMSRILCARRALSTLWVTIRAYFVERMQFAQQEHKPHKE